MKAAGAQLAQHILFPYLDKTVAAALAPQDTGHFGTSVLYCGPLQSLLLSVSDMHARNVSGSRKEHRKHVFKRRKQMGQVVL